VEEEGDNAGESMIKIRGFKTLFRDRYFFKLTIRKYLEIGVKMSVRFLEEARDYDGKIFRAIDTDHNGSISF